MTDALEFVRAQALGMSPLSKFALGMAITFGVPALSRRLRLPAVVGLLLSGVVLGPHILGVSPVAHAAAGGGDARRVRHVQPRR